MVAARVPHNDSLVAPIIEKEAQVFSFGGHTRERGDSSQEGWAERELRGPACEAASASVYLIYFFGIYYTIY